MDLRKNRRFAKKLLVKIYSENFYCGGITGDISYNGLFVRGVLLPNEKVLSIDLYLPGEGIASLKGIVKRNAKITEANWLFGTGIELTEKDEAFTRFVQHLL